MNSVTGSQVRNPEVGVSNPAEAIGVLSESLGEAGRNGSTQVDTRHDSATTKPPAELHKKAAATIHAMKTNLLAGFTPEQVEKIRARFDAKVSPCPITGCFHWDAAVTKEGYGVFALTPPGTKAKGSKTRRIVFAHRLAYELANGPIPPGMTLDHTHQCKCVNPRHVQPVTNLVNIERRDLRRRLRKITFAAVLTALTEAAQ